MDKIKFLEVMTELAKQYRVNAQDSVERNNHMNEIEEGERLQQRHIDALLTDFINFCGTKNGIDYALYTKDLAE
jgi:hypothetical protein